MNADQTIANPRRSGRIILGALDFCGAMGGLFFAAGAILRLWLGADVTIAEFFVLLPFIVGGLALWVIPKWRKPRIIFGVFVSLFLVVCFAAAILSPGIS